MAILGSTPSAVAAADGRRRNRVRSPIPGFLGLALLLVVPLVAEQPVTEYDVKAAFMYNFARLAEWPEVSRDGAGTFTVGILGQDPFGLSIRRVIEGKTVKGLPIRIVYGASAEELRDCNMVFVSSSERTRLPGLLQALSAAPVLTVSDAPEFTERGGMIELFVENSRIRFAINREMIQRSGLRVASTLLTLARPAGGGRQ